MYNRADNKMKQLTPLTHLSILGVVCPSPAYEQMMYEDREGVTDQTLYTFVDFSDTCKCLVMTAPAKDAQDFADRYYSQIVKG